MVWLTSTAKDNATDLTGIYIFFITLLKSCFSTSVFRNAHFLFNVPRSWKNTHFPFLSFLHNALYTLQYCTILFLCFFRCLYEAPIQIKATAALSNYECEHKLHLEKGPGRNLRVATCSWGQGQQKCDRKVGFRVTRPSFAVNRNSFPMNPDQRVMKRLN